MSGCGSSCVKAQTSIPPFGAFTLGQSILAGSAVSGLTVFANTGACLIYTSESQDGAPARDEVQHSLRSKYMTVAL